MFFWYQKSGGQDPWVAVNSNLREKVVSDIKPRFVTVLDASEEPESDWGREQFAAMKYGGPLYFDWDAKEIQDAISGVHQFLLVLEDHGVDPRSVRFYATGGRGFHVEVPQEIFSTQPRKAQQALPYIYREMALELATEFMDLKIYTGRRGRMWRTPNVLREKKEADAPDRYKVPLTFEQVQTITPDSYEEICSTPQIHQPLQPPELSVQLNAAFEKARNKISALIKTRAKSKGDAELLATHNGDYPPSVKMIMEGRNISPNAGFHKIALQLAITANALHKECKEFVDACEGLIKNHSSDSKRYDSPRKRKEELRRLWEYTHDNDLYEYSAGPIKSLLAVGTVASDLDPKSNLPSGMVDKEQYENLSAEARAALDNAEDSLIDGVAITPRGVFRVTADGVKQLSSVSLSAPGQMIDVESGELLGMTAECSVDGNSHGRVNLSQSLFKSRSTFNDYCMSRSGIFNGTDQQVSSVYQTLTRQAMQDNNSTYITRREGIDLIRNPTKRGTAEYDIVLVTPDAVLGNTDVRYQFVPRVTTSAVHHSDLHLVVPMEATDENRVWLTNVLGMNSPRVVGLMLGWFVSCFHKQFYQVSFGQFPLLHPNGPAGSGKTQTTTAMARMFYASANPPIHGASANASTAFSLKGYWTSSASIPVIIDEYKPSELGIQRHDFLLQHFRMLYNQADGSSGGMSKGGALSDFRDVARYNYSAPTIYLGESQEMQTAIVQRSISVQFSESESRKYTAAFNAATDLDNHLRWPALGALLMRRVLQETLDERKRKLVALRDRLRRELPNHLHDRRIYNIAVVVAGLEFFAETMQALGYGDLVTKVEELRDGVVRDVSRYTTTAIPEMYKVINDMAVMSHMEDSESEHAMREGYEYIVGEGYVEIALREAFIKYHSWTHRRGFRPLYSSVESYLIAMQNCDAVIDAECFGSPLRTSAASKVYRYALDKLASVGVEVFKTRHLA